MHLNNKGFSLLEVLSSLVILLMVITTVVPILMKVYQERTIIDYKREALKILHTERETFLYDTATFYPKIIVSGIRHYNVNLESKGNLMEMCVYWEVPWSGYGQICTFTNKD